MDNDLQVVGGLRMESTLRVCYLPMCGRYRLSRRKQIIAEHKKAPHE
jgi:hypothetical protein